MSEALARRALALLRPWVDFAERDWSWATSTRTYPAAQSDAEGGPMGYYGCGYSDVWSVHTNFKYLAVLAVLVSGEQDAGMGGNRADSLRDRALAALRYGMAGHLSGPSTCADGGRWGHTWISALGFERMMHGLHLMGTHLTEDDRAALRRVMLDEATWLCDHHERGVHRGVFGDPWNASGKNVPESNLWNGVALWRAAVMYPEHPRAADFRERAHQFLVNAVSVPADAADERVLAGKAIRERHVGANYFPHFALDHHGYLNVGYMASCVSNAAILHFDLKLAGLERPETLDHHQEELWGVLRRMVFDDGRLARIGGDSRVRYAYCQDSMIFSYLFAADRWGDPHALELLERQLTWIERETAFNGDGSFYGGRLGWLAKANPHYYTRLESDRANALGMLVAYAGLVNPPSVPPSVPPSAPAPWSGTWAEHEHGAALHRSPTRLASFSWRAYGLAQGLCLPPDDGHLAEWEQNLAGGVEFVHHTTGASSGPRRRLLRHHIETFDGGFLTTGAVMEGVDVELAEGWKGTDSGVHQLAFVALPDDHTVVLLQHCRVGERRAYIAAVKGLSWNVPNDLFNGFARRLTTARGVRDLTSPPAEATEALDSAWLNVDDRIGAVGLYGAETFHLNRACQRRAGRMPSLFVEQVYWPYRGGPFGADAAAVVLDAGTMILSGVSAAETQRLAAANRAVVIPAPDPDVRAVRVEACDGRHYVIAANFGVSPSQLPTAQLCRANEAVHDVVSRAALPAAAQVEIAPGGGRLLRIEPAV